MRPPEAGQDRSRVVRTAVVANVALAMALALSGCTIIGGVTGGLLASHHNGDLPPDHAPDQERSTPLWILIPAVVGLALDLTYLNYVASQWSKPLT